jgi:hypothetical protein
LIELKKGIKRVHAINKNKRKGAAPEERKRIGNLAIENSQAQPT